MNAEKAHMMWAFSFFGDLFPSAVTATGTWVKSPAQNVWGLNDYTAGAVIYIIMIGGLVSLLIAGGILVVNLALMSKRAEDHVGGRVPSDVGLLKNTTWPEVPYLELELPAEPTDMGAMSEVSEEAPIGGNKPNRIVLPNDVAIDMDAQDRQDWHKAA
jgi:hypothetical protein